MSTDITSETEVGVYLTGNKTQTFTEEMLQIIVFKKRDKMMKSFFMADKLTKFINENQNHKSLFKVSFWEKKKRKTTHHWETKAASFLGYSGETRKSQ